MTFDEMRSQIEALHKVQMEMWNHENSMEPTQPEDLAKIRASRIREALMALYAHAVAEMAKNIRGEYDSRAESSHRARVEGLRWAIEMFDSATGVENSLKKYVKI